MTKKNNIEKLIKPIEFTELEIKVDENEVVKFKVYNDISLDDRVKMVRSIYEMVIASEEFYDISNYQPFLRVFARGFNILTYFTDLKLPTKIETLNSLILNTDLVDNVLEAMNPRARATLTSIFNEAEDLMQVYIKTSISNRNYRLIIDKVDSIIDGLTTHFKDIDVNEVKGILSNLKGVAGGDLIKTILDLQEDKK